MKKSYKEARMAILIGSPPGSPNYAIAALDKAGTNCPPWTPREASVEEQQELKKTRDMQDLIRRHMGSRSMRSVNSDDMQAILVDNFGARWSEELQYYQDAINSMDQGVYL